MAVQIAKALGATVIATAGSAEKTEVARRYGADHTINYREDEDWVSTVKELTNGRGADVIYDPVGLAKQSTRCVACRSAVLCSAVLSAITCRHATLTPPPMLVQLHRVERSVPGRRFRRRQHPQGRLEPRAVEEHFACGAALGGVRRQRTGSHPRRVERHQRHDCVRQGVWRVSHANCCCVDASPHAVAAVTVEIRGVSQGIPTRVIGRSPWRHYGTEDVWQGSG